MPYTNYTPKAVDGQQITTREIMRTPDNQDNMLLGQIEELDKSLIEYFPDTLVIDNALTRKLVSFQANKAVHTIDGTNTKRRFPRIWWNIFSVSIGWQKGKYWILLRARGPLCLSVPLWVITLKALNSYRLGKKSYRQMCSLEVRINKGLFLD